MKAAKKSIGDALRARKDTVALVDVEIMAYQVCLEALQEHRQPDGTWTWTLDEGAAVLNLKARITDAATMAGCGEVVLAVGSANNWRRRLCPSYKSNRDGKKKPLGYRAVMEQVEEEFKTVKQDWLEADDVLGILATGAYNYKSVIVSSDKDMATVPCRLFNPSQPEEGVTTYTEEQADVEHAVQIEDDHILVALS